MPALTASLPGRNTSDTADQDDARPGTLFSSVLQLCIEVLSCICVPLLLKCLAVWQGLARTAHELLSRFLALPPCQVYPPRESAVVIVGGDDDVGRHLALTFSEQGCTVFALCPDHPAQASPAQSSREAAQDTSNVSELIQEWHKRIKRSGRSPRWGLLAPIVLDMNSGAQRAHAVETVDAYCATHNLHLVAVIVLPSSAPAPPRPEPQPLAGGAADVAAWADVVRRCLVAPIAVVHGYSKLLAAASGRVVLVLASGDQLGMHSAHLHALESAAQFLRREWGLLGIRVATVSAGPFAPASKQADDAAR
ncbi:hypothetical protein TRAPUB_8873 [Trametes pubescens]|uniref:Uncharacterized protein n=1 Tax=Trametes pubescens TaxID=154538 RepID=A0A1M2W433_TRAPU|nr:hypothetical protein TRAPUB_8873 [Trametes pubescens]